jgi:hypothetical protein
MSSQKKFEFSDLPEDWKDIVTEMMNEGAAIKEVLREFGMPFTAHDRLMKEQEEYRETIKLGETLSEGWWLKTGRTNLDNKQFNNTLWVMNMNNRFGWKDGGRKPKQPKVGTKKDEEAVRAKYKVEVPDDSSEREIQH